MTDIVENVVDKLLEGGAAPSLPRLGATAPDFEAESTQGPLRLSSYRGKWVVLFSHPADFTPVCTTEFLAFAEVAPELARRNVALVGLSIDSNYSHIAWLRNIRERFGVAIDFPVIADINRKVATLYGMLSPYESDTAASRCVFMIDDKGVLRAMIYYPMTLGRSMEEIVRIVDALQLVDRETVSIPANWHPGDKVIVPPPKTMDAAEKRLEEGFECADWYFCKKAV